MRPRRLTEVAGQDHLLGVGQPLARLVAAGALHSAILWGPPGTGKTTLARLLATTANAQFLALSAVQAGIAEVRSAVAAATAESSRPTVLFVDEVHRFNKAQQDAFLPWIEDGTIVFIGATTENPAFSLNNALLSRARVYVLKPLGVAAITGLLRTALTDAERGLGALALRVADADLERLAMAADGDARRALNLLQIACDLATGGIVGADVIATVTAGGVRRFDRQGDIFHDQISALHKSVRGSDPDAALYWLVRMLDGGCDPQYVARRIVRMAVEDIGNADPRGLAIAIDAWSAFERLGSPEGELALAQAVVFLACAAKSNAVYQAMAEVRADVDRTGTLEVPVELRNASTALARSLGHGAGYRYPHDEPDAFAAGVTYLPAELAGREYYQPVARGLEQRIAEKLAEFRARHHAALTAAAPSPRV
jgi:putative ATPase